VVILIVIVRWRHLTVLRIHCNKRDNDWHVQPWWKSAVCTLDCGDPPKAPPPDNPLYVITPFFAAVRGSVRVRTPLRGSDRVRSTGYCQFWKHYPPGSVLRRIKGSYGLEGYCPGQIWPSILGSRASCTQLLDRSVWLHQDKNLTAAASVHTHHQQLDDAWLDWHPGCCCCWLESWAIRQYLYSNLFGLVIPLEKISYHKNWKITASLRYNFTDYLTGNRLLEKVNQPTVFWSLNALMGILKLQSNGSL